MRLKGGMFAEFCIGAGTVLLVAAALFYFASPAARRAEESVVWGAEFEKRYDALHREIKELESGMAIRGDEGGGGRWIAREEPDGEDEMCGFSAGIWSVSGDASLRTSVSFVRSEDVSVDQIFLMADGEEIELSLKDARRETEALDGENAGEKIELSEDASLRQLMEAVKAEEITVRFQGGGESFYARLTETQVQNLKGVLRLFGLLREARALDELRGMR